MLLNRISLTAILLLFVYSIVAAQNTENSFNEGEDIITPLDQAKLDKAQLVVSSLDDPCAIDWDFSTEIIKYNTFSKVRLHSALVGAPFSIRRSDGSEFSKGKVERDYLVLTIKEEGNFFVYSYDKCGEKVIATTFTTIPRAKDDPLDVSRKAYNSITEWQKSETDLETHFKGELELDVFTKTSLLQQLLYSDQPLKDNFAKLDVLPGKSDFIVDKSLMDDCQCNLVRLAMNYLVAPSKGTVSRNIWGIYGSKTKQPFRGGDITVNQYWAYEGPSRFQSMHVGTNRCVNAPYNFFWNRNAATQGTQEDEGEAVLPLDMTASIEFNWVCRDASGQPSDCSCDRNVSFDWDYESVVGTKAEIIKGGTFCGSNRNARASAVDVVSVSYSEINDASTYQMLAFQPNGQTSTCSQTYNGPTIAEFLQFAFTIYQFTQGPPSSGTNGQTAEQIQSEWEDNLINTAIGQISDALDEPWLEKTACDVELSGQRRSLRQTRNTGFSAVLKQNKPIRIVLGASGTLEASGLRKWKTESTIYSSFRLAGIMEGGGSRDLPANDCCSPYIGSWLLSTIADDVPGGSSTSNFRSATRAFLNIQGLTANVDRNTGHKYSYNGFTCPAPMQIRIVGPSLTDGGFDDIFALRQTGDNFDLEIKRKFTEEIVPIGLFSASGQRLNLLEVSPESSTNFMTGMYPAGVYFLSAILPNGRTIAKKIIVQ